MYEKILSGFWYGLGFMISLLFVVAVVFIFLFILASCLEAKDRISYWWWLRKLEKKKKKPKPILSAPTSNMVADSVRNISPR